MTLPPAGRWKRICMICEVMHAPLDEGIRIFAASLARALAPGRDLLLVSEKDSEIDGLPVHGLLQDRFFLRGDLAGRIRSFGPEAIIYVPWTSLTARTLFRVGSLRRAGRAARIGVVALQPRGVGLAGRVMTLIGRPDIVMTAGPGAQRQARGLGLDAVRIGAGVDLQKFRPAGPAQREALRRRAGIPPGSFVVLHVGHVKESRNVGILERIAAMEGITCMLVASSSTTAQSDLLDRLAAAGVIVMRHHQDRIEFAYQISDAYLFPVTSRLDAIELPLSVLEAAACDLRIIATRFGGLPDLLGSDAAVTWIDSAAGAEEALARMRSAGGGAAGGTRRKVESCGWQDVAARAIAALDSVDAAGGSE